MNPLAPQAVHRRGNTLSSTWLVHVANFPGAKATMPRRPPMEPLSVHVSQEFALEAARLVPIYLHLAACCVVACFEVKRMLAVASQLAEADRHWSRCLQGA